jgi:hypothetical protein
MRWPSGMRPHTLLSGTHTLSHALPHALQLRHVRAKESYHRAVVKISSKKRSCTEIESCFSTPSEQTSRNTTRKVSFFFFIVFFKSSALFFFFLPLSARRKMSYTRRKRLCSRTARPLPSRCVSVAYGRMH